MNRYSFQITKVKIPTLLAIFLLLLAIILAFGLFYLFKKVNDEDKVFYEPKEIRIVNISDTSATITWQTDREVIGKAIISTGSNINENPFSNFYDWFTLKLNIQSGLKKVWSDERDGDNEQARSTHFITVSELSPNSKYYFKLKNNQYTFFDQSLEFNTAPAINEDNNSVPGSKLEQPILGIVLTRNLNPVDQALVYFQSDGSEELATYTSQTGNFIIPLRNLRTKSLDNLYDFTTKNTAKLQVIKQETQSDVTITFPIDNISLPPIVFGDDMDFRFYIASPPASIAVNDTIVPTKPTLDLNKDSKINTLDLAILSQAVKQNSPDSRFDLNEDGKTDSDDITFLRESFRN